MSDRSKDLALWKPQAQTARVHTIYCCGHKYARGANWHCVRCGKPHPRNWLEGRFDSRCRGPSELQ